MLSFAQLAHPLKSVLLTVMFVTVCISICLIPGVCRRKHKLFMVLVPVSSLLCGMMLVFYDAHVKCFKPGWTRYGPVERFAELPLIVTLSLLAFIILLLALTIRELVRYRSSTLTHAAIKEGMDHLPTGLCFAHPTGRVMLVNHRMNELCHILTGSDLQNANAFWSFLAEGDVQPSVVRLSSGERPSVQLPDGSVWTFSRVTIDGVVQLAAADISQLNALTDELKSKNAALSAMNLRLRQYNENVAQLTKERELLEIKAQIHSSLGRALLSTRRYLLDNSIGTGEILHTWKRNISLLRKETELTRETPHLEMLMDLAASSGIRVELSGHMPEEQSASRLFLEGSIEALTNAVGHANAKTLWIQLDETETAYTVCFVNDGIPVEGPVIEGGGLDSLRKKAERIGGTLVISPQPKFTLTMTIPKRRGEETCIMF